LAMAFVNFADDLLQRLLATFPGYVVAPLLSESHNNLTRPPNLDFGL